MVSPPAMLACRALAALRLRALLCIAPLIMYLHGIPWSSAADAQIMVAKAGQNVTVWKGWNVYGKVYVKLQSQEKDTCATFWWLVVGIKREIGMRCNNVEVEATFPLLYAELRVGSISKETAIAVSDSAAVAYSQELCGRVVDC